MGPTPSLLYDPASPFSDLISIPARWKVYYGGRGAAKSWAIAEALVTLASQLNIRILCAREIMGSIQDSVHRLLWDRIEDMGYTHLFRITAYSIRSVTGAEFIFKGLKHNIREIKSLEGVQIVWIEEAQAVSEESWRIFVPTIREPNSEIWVSFNPDLETDPTYKRLVLNPEPGAIVHRVNYPENPFFPKVLDDLRLFNLKAIEDAQSDDERAQAQADYDHIWMGETRRVAKEIILSGKTTVQAFDDELWKSADRVFYGIDWGFAQDPMAVVRSFIIENDLYVSHEAYATGVEIDGGRDAQNRGEMERFIDSVPGTRYWPLKCDSGRPEMISYVTGMGFNASGADKWDGSVEDGIAHLRGFRRIFIHPRCKGVERESRLYKYRVDKTTQQVLPIVVDKDNHAIDALRYSLDGFIQRRGALGIWQRMGSM